MLLNLLWKREGFTKKSLNGKFKETETKAPLGFWVVCVTTGDWCLLWKALDHSQAFSSLSSQSHFHTLASDFSCFQTLLTLPRVLVGLWVIVWHQKGLWQGWILPELVYISWVAWYYWVFSNTWGIRGSGFLEVCACSLKTHTRVCMYMHTSGPVTWPLTVFSSIQFSFFYLCAYSFLPVLLKELVYVKQGFMRTGACALHSQPRKQVFILWCHFLKSEIRGKKVSQFVTKIHDSTADSYDSKAWLLISKLQTLILQASSWSFIDAQSEYSSFIPHSVSLDSSHFPHK